MRPDPVLVLLKSNILQRKQEFRFVSKPVVAVRCGDAGGSINDPFVKDQSVTFYSLSISRISLVVWFRSKKSSVTMSMFLR